MAIPSRLRFPDNALTTPARRQYLRIKKEHEDAILLFRMGDFYETFDEDARLISRELEIALTSREMGRGQRIPLAGIPYHSLEPYLARLIKKGHKVAICEQTSDPAQSKGLVDRAVVRVVTAGTVIEDALLEGGANNYLAAAVVDEQHAGLAYVDITTSEFAVSQFPIAHLDVELVRLAPSELLVPERQEPTASPTDTRVTPLEADAFDLEWATETLLGHFGVASLEAYGCDGLPLAVRAAGAIVDYLGRHHGAALSQVTSLYTYFTDAYMVLDAQTRRNLELFEGGRWGDRSASLLSVLDRTRTSMGGRLLRRWVGQPLLDVARLEERLDAVSWFHRSALRRARVSSVLDRVSDIERLVNRVRGGVATPRDLVGLAASVEAAPQLRGIMTEDDDAPQVAWLAERIEDNADVSGLVRRAIGDDPPPTIGDGGVIRDGFSPELDALRSSSREAQDYIAALEPTERKRTGIKNLKVGYNRVFGYYIEISKANLDRVPEEYVRRQTLVGGERFITPEMKEYESLVMNAQERVADLEASLFRQVCGQLRPPEAGRWRRSRDQRRTPPGRRADPAARLLRSQRHEDVERRRAAHRADGAQHGGQVDLHQAGRSHHPDGADRQLRPRRVRLSRPRRQDIHASRPAGRPRGRSVDVHGGDGRDGGDPEPRHVPVAGDPGRDRTRHQHVRRACHRAGGGRVRP